MLRRILGPCFRGQMIGIFVGYIISFFFQNELIKHKLGFGGYISHFIDVLFKSFGNNMSEVAITAWVCMILGAIGGHVAELSMVKKGIIKPWPRPKDADENK